MNNDLSEQVKEALEIVEEYIVDRDARGTMRTETLETIRTALLALTAENKEKDKEIERLKKKVRLNLWHIDKLQELVDRREKLLREK